MDTTKATAVLFDFDGVVVDTETQYSHFWHEMGKQYLGMDDIEGRVKGQTLVYIYDTFFPGMAKEQAEITERLNRFEDCRSDQLQRSEDGSCLSGSSRNKDSFRPYPYGRDVYGFQACTGLFSVGYGGFRHNSRHHICIRGFLQRAESRHGFRSYRYRVGNHQFP